MDCSISVIIPCRNGSQYLPEAVEGIRRQNMEIELIVVDDGSTDTTTDLAKKMGCIVKSIPHSGLSAARNIGLKFAHGEVVLFHDHDDVMRQGALRKLVDSLWQDDMVGIVMARAKDFISSDLSAADKSALNPRPDPYYGLLSGAVLFRHSVFRTIGSFTEGLATGQTMDIILRAEAAGIQVKRLDFVAVDRRLHNNNMGRSMQQQEHRDYASILRLKLGKINF